MDPSQPKKIRKKKLEKNIRPSDNSSNPRKNEDGGALFASVAAERDRLRHRKKDSTPNQLDNISDDVEPSKTRKKVKKTKKVKKKFIKSNNGDDGTNSNSVNSQNKDYINDDPNEAPPLAMPFKVKDKLKEQLKQNEQAVRKTSTKIRTPKNKQPVSDSNSANVPKKTRKKKKYKRPLKKKIENPESNAVNNNVNLNNSPKRTIHRIIINKSNSSNREPLIKSDISDEEESASSKKVINKPKNVNGIRPSSSASSTKSLNQKHKDTSSKGKNYSDTSNNSNAIKKSSSSVSSKKIPIIKDEYDEKIDSTIDEEEEVDKKYIPKLRNDEIINQIKKQMFDSDDKEPSRSQDENHSSDYDKNNNNNYENEEEEEEEEDDNENEAMNEKDKSKSKYDYSDSNDDINNLILSPVHGREHRPLSDGTLKDINNNTHSNSGIIGSIVSQSDDDYSYDENSNDKQANKRKNKMADFIITNNKVQKIDLIRRNKNDYNRGNSDPTLDFLEFNDSASSGKKKVNFDNFNNQNNKRTNFLNVNMDINLNRNPNRHQSVRIQKINPQINNNNNNFIRNNGSNINNKNIDIGPIAFPKFIPKPHNFHLQNHSNAKFPINDDEFHDFEQTSKKKINLSPPIDFQIQIIPNPPIIAIDDELSHYNRDILLKEIKRQQ